MKTNLKQIRKNAGWSNADDFAAHIGMPAKTYRNYEQGVRKIGLDVASLLCNELGCTIEDLVDERYEYGVIELPKEEAIDPDEQKLLMYYRNMDDEHRKILLNMAMSFNAINDPMTVWLDQDGNERTGAEIRGLR